MYNLKFLGDVVDLLVDYFNRFVRKPICVLDLKPYISLLSTEAKSIFRKRISEAAEIKDEESPSSVILLGLNDFFIFYISSPSYGSYFKFCLVTSVFK